MADSLGIKRIYQVDRHTLGIEWSDGVEGAWRLSSLRRHCPCAACVDEWTRERTLDASTVDDDLVASKVESVGRYGIRVTFADGHNTGIYSYALLRQLGGQHG